MNCREFEEKIDFYLDGALEGTSLRGAIDHVSICSNCESMVTDAQQVSALLKTAVSDRIAAVDVSGLWESIERELGPSLPSASRPTVRPVLAGWRDVLVERWRTLTTAPAGPRSATWAYRPGRTFGFLTATAVAAVLVLGSWLAEPQRVQVADSGGRSKTRAVQIESLEVPAGYTVSTWKRPRSRTQFISVTSDGGFGVSNAGYSPGPDTGR